MRWVRPQSFLSREAAHERWRAHGCAAVFSAQGLMWHMVVTRGARNCSVAGSAQRWRKRARRCRWADHEGATSFR
jgi:hypothetical protein